MKPTSITDAKNGLSALIERVKAGESVVITDRGVPVARLSPIALSSDPTGRAARLVRAGLAQRGSGAASDAILRDPPGAMPEDESIVDIVLAERIAGW